MGILLHDLIFRCSYGVYKLVNLQTKWVNFLSKATFYDTRYYDLKKFFLKALTILLIFVFSIVGCLSSEDKGESALQDIIDDLNGEPVVPREANRLFISGFRNLTNVPLLSEKLMIKLKSQINMDGRLAVVSRYDYADLKLNGIVFAYQLQPIVFENTGEPVRKRLRIITSVKLFDLKKDKEIFFERGIQAFEEFSEITPPISSEILIQEKILDNLAKRIALKIMDGWYTKLMTPIEKGKK